LAQLDVLFHGYVGERTASTVSLVRDGDLVIVIDPGMVPARDVILSPLDALGITPRDVTDVIVSHHHPDHTINIALFPDVRIHDHWAIYHHDLWTSRPADGFELSPSVRLIETPGHTPQDITTLVDTDAGTAALTHLWWFDGHDQDPYAVDHELLDRHRQRVLETASLIIPGHGAPFAVD
jgi:glyoxylase-like metal-dependent hydrolase (beta-lactamase superfamily II)